jgi:hypothetical protein
MGWLLFENNEGGHHALNIFLHLVNGVLVYRLAALLFGSRRFAGLVSLVFLLHPLQLETVGWISELKNTLSAAFYFASILCYLEFCGSARGKYYFLSLLLFIAGCLSKSSAVVLPLSLLCIDVLRTSSIRGKFLLDKIPFLALSMVFGIINLRTQAADLFINYSHMFPYHERVGYAGYALFKYLTMFIFPYELSVLYPYPSNTALAFITGSVSILAIALLTIRWIRKNQFAPLALTWLCICNLVLVLQFVP